MINPISELSRSEMSSLGTPTRICAWGTVTVLDESDRYRINRIEVEPGASMCLQMHHHRSEHWVIVSGTATVKCNDKITQLIPKQSTYVPMVRVIRSLILE